MHKLWYPFGGTSDLVDELMSFPLKLDKKKFKIETIKGEDCTVINLRYINENGDVEYTKELCKNKGTTFSHHFKRLVLLGLLELEDGIYSLTKYGEKYIDLINKTKNYDSENFLRELYSLLLYSICQPTTYIGKELYERAESRENFSQMENIIGIINNKGLIDKNDILSNMTNVSYYEPNWYKTQVYEDLKKSNINDKTGKVKSLKNGYVLNTLIGLQIISNESNQLSISPLVKDVLANRSLNVNGGKPMQVIYSGIPGSGKSYKVSKEILNNVPEKYVKRVVFYNGYDYSDFVGMYKPSYDENGNPAIRFNFGPLGQILKEAVKDINNQYYLIIEEINRGNAPAIFGDCFQLLDRDMDKTSDNYGNSVYKINNNDLQEIEGFEEGVFFPRNLNIIATMNSSDQNTFPLDTAFKRRFDIKYVSNPIDSISDEVSFFDMKWKDFCHKINKYILEELKLPEDKQIGAYFADEECFLEEKVLLYLFEDVENCNYNSGKIFNETIKSKDDLMFLLSNEYKKEKISTDLFSEELMEYINKDE